MGDLKLGAVTPDSIKFGALDVDKIFQGEEEVFGGGGGFELVIAADVANYNIYDELILLGWNGTTPGDVLVTINPGVYVWADVGTIPGLSTGALPVGSTVFIQNDGFIMGRGGNGGSWTIVGVPGGQAINTVVDITIDNQLGYIGGGGGGGGPSGNLSIGQGGGGAGGGDGGGWIGSGGDVGQQGTDGIDGATLATGGGGGRILPGVGGAARSSSVQNTVLPGLGGGSGGSGGMFIWLGTSTSGAGGSAGALGGNGSAGSLGNAGGGGGGWGAAGGFGNSDQGNVAGGAGGKAVELNGSIITWVNGTASSDRAYGAVS